MSDFSVIGDESALISEAQRSPAAFHTLYNLYMVRIYRYVRSRVQSNEEAEDLTQQVFLQALNALPQYRFRGVPFAAWLFRIASHTVTDAYRHQGSMLSWNTLPDILYTSSEQEPEASILHKEALAHLHDLLQSLDPYKQELIALRFAAGLSTPEIAVVVGKSPAAVKKQLTRILQSLKEHYHAK